MNLLKIYRDKVGAYCWWGRVVVQGTGTPDAVARLTGPAKNGYKYQSILTTEFPTKNDGKILSKNIFLSKIE
jgi:hypothetical protein